MTKENNKQEENKSISFWSLFRFAGPKDLFWMILGAICSIIHGGTFPFLSLLLGDIADSFNSNNTPDEVVSAAGTIAWQIALVGVVSSVTCYIANACWMIVGEKQSIEIRKRYFKALLTQEIAFYDSINPNELSSKIAEECFNIQQGIGEKVPTCLYSVSMLIIGFVIGFIRGWQLTLVMFAFIPAMAITGSVFALALQKMAKVNSEAYSKAGAISEEALNAIRTIVSLGGQEKETKRYHATLYNEKGKINKYALICGIAMGSVYLAMYGLYALAFFVGSIFMRENVQISSDNYYTAGSVLTIFFAVLNASGAPARATPCIKAFALAKAAGTKAFKVIDRKSNISIEDPRGLKPKSVEGNISFRNVTFAYPSKPDMKILKGISFDIRRNEKTALVGESGCGKTTCLQLIERFYDVENGNGTIELDGNELKELNLKWMRENIGYVGQEPVLFATSIRENLLMAKDDASDEEVWEALRKANAADFIRTLPDKLNTFVGTNGAQLSGGQKQRLAIARAILKNPKILLLDEATSALDRKNEMEIQKTLDEISVGRTTIVIAHRLSTIQNADHIIVFDQGKVVEEGRHEDLVEKKGRYYSLQRLQLQTEEKETEKPLDDKDEDEFDSPKKQDQIKALTTMNDQEPKKTTQTLSGKEVEIELEPLQSKMENSKGDQKVRNRKGKSKVNKPNYNVFVRLLKYSPKDIPLTIISIISAAVQGCAFPLTALLVANMTDVLAFPNAPDFRSRANLISLFFFIIAIVACIAGLIQWAGFTIIAENLSRKVRADVFQKYVRMPVGWFDQPENAPGALGSKLSTDAAQLNSLTSGVYGVYIQAVSSFVTGVVIAFTANWRLALVGVGMTPFIIIAGKLRSKFSEFYVQQKDKAYQSSVQFASEAVNNMRTVVSFGKEDKLLKNYSDKLQEPLRAAIKTGHYSGLASGFGEISGLAIHAVLFYVGAIFIRDGNLTFKDMFQVIFGVVFAAAGTSNVLQFSPDVGAAKAAAYSIFGILDTKPAIDIDDPKQTVRKAIKGDVEFKNVWFKYPSREKQIFRGLNLKISAASKVALVGASGCGKSTILALLQRFYDPDQGQILVDGVDIKQYDLKHLRENFGVVSQEPVLFNETIAYNIKYSKEDATDEEMRQAAIKANAIGFIEKNEFDVNDDSDKYGKGFNRKVGPKGSQMSGGQKQRIAIARAILKNPSFLILDEATSALDAENEKLVQASLDTLMEGKTSLIVAHRISTIKDADEIIMFNEGEIKERGNYKQLMEMQGMFYQLEKGINH